MSISNSAFKKLVLRFGNSAVLPGEASPAKLDKPVEESIHGNARDTMASIMSVDNLVKDATFPLRSPFALKRNFQA